MRRMSKRIKVQQPDESQTQLDDQGSDTTHTSFGLFANIPTEMVINILQYLPFESIANLAVTSREWQRFLENWLDTWNAKQLISCRIADKRTSKLKQEVKRTKILTFSALGFLVRRASMFSPPRRNSYTRTKVLHHLMAEVNLSYVSPDEMYATNLRAFGAFLKSCLRSSSENDIMEVTEAVLRRSRARICLSTMLRRAAGKRPFHELRLRTLVRELFQSSSSLQHAVRLLGNYLVPSETARFAYVLWGPCVNDRIIWDISCRASTIDKFQELAELLSLCWRQELLHVKTLLPALRSGPFWWREESVACLYALLDEDVAISLISNSPETEVGLLVALSLVKDELTWKILDYIQKTRPKRTYAKLIRGMLRTIQISMRVHKGVHLWCNDCPLEKLAYVKVILEG